MNITIKATNITLTPELHSVCEKKLGGLKHFIDIENPNVVIHVELSKITKHATGDVFRADVNIRSAGKLIKAVSDGQDFSEALDKVKDELAQEFKKVKGKKTSLFRRGARRIKNLLRFGRDNSQS